VLTLKEIDKIQSINFELFVFIKDILNTYLILFDAMLKKKAYLNFNHLMKINF